jgi:tRNA modification GTPase
VLRQDTIAAIATPFGQAGVGIIRISGPQAAAIARRIFKPAHQNCSWESHRLYHGDIVTADGKAILDEVLISLMCRPHSFTGEDVLEIHCHGNPLILQAVLEELMELGCRPARPGEFSQRAFFNNRLDLSQAEALAAMVAARSSAACKMALAQLKGALGLEIENLRLLLIDALAFLEAAVDFSEDVEAGQPVLPGQIDQALCRLQELLASYSNAKPYTEGINCVITGKPNVGKSSLLNSLLGRKRAIVTDIPGTTRDLITDTITIGGISINLADTAGIRQPQDAIEREGIDLVWEKLAEADVVIMLLDASRELSQEDVDILVRTDNANTIVAINKIDLPPAWEIDAIEYLRPFQNNIQKISAKFGTGLPDLKKAVIALSGNKDGINSDHVLITNLRHKQALEKTQANILRAKNSILNGLSPEFAAFDLREALDNLDEITGKKINGEILDKIFSSFCIGK